VQQYCFLLLGGPTPIKHLTEQGVPTLLTIVHSRSPYPFYCCAPLPIPLCDFLLMPYLCAHSRQDIHNVNAVLGAAILAGWTLTALVGAHVAQVSYITLQYNTIQYSI